MRFIALIVLSLLSFPILAEDVSIVRLPRGAVQAQAAVDSKGRVHVIYLQGDPAKADIMYARLSDDGTRLENPQRVGQAGSAIAMGTVRGAHIAIGKNDRVHIAWNGSSEAKPRGEGMMGAPLLYTRLADDGKTFEPQRGMAKNFGLDGGGSVAADADGHVYVVWHGPGKSPGEAERRVYVARSDDEGKTFAAQTPVNPEATGACGCCGLRVAAGPGGQAYILYRTAREQVHRDMILLSSSDAARTFNPTTLVRVEFDKCLMSTSGTVNLGNDVLGTWESHDRVYWAKLAGDETNVSAAPRGRQSQKHAVLAADPAGRVLMAWAEGTGWQKGGAVAWQIYDRDGKPVANATGRKEDLPAWGLPAAAWTGKSFVLIY